MERPSYHDDHEDGKVDDAGDADEETEGRWRHDCDYHFVLMWLVLVFRLVVAVVSVAEAEAHKEWTDWISSLDFGSVLLVDTINSFQPPTAASWSEWEVHCDNLFEVIETSNETTTTLLCVNLCIWGDLHVIDVLDILRVCTKTAALDPRLAKRCWWNLALAVLRSTHPWITSMSAWFPAPVQFHEPNYALTSTWHVLREHGDESIPTVRYSKIFWLFGINILWQSFTSYFWCPGFWPSEEGSHGDSPRSWATCCFLP